MNILILYIIVNFLADQLLQAKEIRQNKDKDTSAFIIYIITWFMPMFLMTAYFAAETGSLMMINMLFFLTAIKVVVGWSFLRLWTNLYHQNKKHKAVFVILLEQLIMNLVIMIMYNHAVNY